MFAEQLRRAVEASPRAELPTVSGLLWRAYAAGQVSEDQASELSEMIEARRALPAAQKPAQRRLGSRPRSPALMGRRRRWAASGCLPPALAARFTLAETAVLAVLAAETRKRGDCRLTNGELADVAGVSVTTVKNALRAARALGLISVEERRLTAFRNHSNVVRITDASWRAWLRLGVGANLRRPHLPAIKTSVHAGQNRHSPRQCRCNGEPRMTNASMVKITNLGVDDPALPKPNPPPPTPVPATETDPQWIVTEDPPDSPQVQPERP